jgi:hypothetical protein
MTARRLAISVAVLTALASGGYVFLYLYRWEWNRALIAGVVFIAAEMALFGIAILDRLRKFDRRLETIERLDNERVLSRIKEAAPQDRRHFAWLTDVDGPSVFVPVLMGAGIVISALAWGIEKLARRTGGPVLERRLADRLSPIALPERSDQAAGSEFPRRKPVVRVAQQLLLAAVLVAGVFALAGATQNRPDEIRDGTSSIVSLDVFTSSGAGTANAAERLWQSCAGTVPSRAEPDAIEVSSGTAVSLRLSPALGINGERRLRGCLEDATLDKVQAAVRRVEQLRP